MSTRPHMRTEHKWRPLTDSEVCSKVAGKGGTEDSDRGRPRSSALFPITWLARARARSGQRGADASEVGPRAGRSGPLSCRFAESPHPS